MTPLVTTHTHTYTFPGFLHGEGKTACIGGIFPTDDIILVYYCSVIIMVNWLRGALLEKPILF